MSKHLNHQEITNYRQSLLAPTELLTVDNHLANCENCRRKIRQTQDLAMLYESFFEPVNAFAVNGANARLKGKWNWLKKLRFFNVAALLANRQPAIAFALAAILIVVGFWLFRQKSEQPINEISANTVFEEKLPVNISPSPADEKANETDKNVQALTASDNSISPVKAIKKQPLPVERAALNKSKIEDINIEVSRVETDESQTLSANSGANNNAKLAPTLKVAKLKNNLSVDFSAVEEASEYEIYLAEMPKFVTVSRAKVKNTNWTIPRARVKAGQNYVLQVTALKNGQPIGSIQKIISVKAVKKQ